MKRIFLASAILLFTLTGCDTAQQVLSGMGQTTGAGGLSNAEITSGLKEALIVGANNSTSQLSSVDGFFKNAAVKIWMPEEARKVESTLRSVGMGSLVDKAILSMNRAAEEAAKGAGTIFINAVRDMTITDAVNILRGGDFAATNYFKMKTTDALTQSFRPVINRALADVNATKYWSDVTTMYNQFASTKVNTDLAGYVTQKAMDGIFLQLGQEEQKIRKDPVARTSEILRKVFGSRLAQAGGSAR